MRKSMCGLKQGRKRRFLACALICLCGALLAARCDAQSGQAAVQKRDAARPAGPASPAGEWIGTLQVGDSQLHLVLHLTRDPRGKWQAKLDSLDQAVYGMDAANVNFEADTLHFEMPTVGAQFEGQLPPDQRTIRGVWQQGGTALPLRFERRAPGAEARAAANAVSRAEGTWQGAIVSGNMKLRFQLHVAHSDKSELLASMDSLDQGIQGIPASNVTEKGGQLKFEIPAFGAQYTGTLSATHNEIRGQWAQNDNLEELNFTRSEHVPEVVRPQTPAKPYPYREEQVSFHSGDDKILLAGTLTLPQGNGPFAAAVLVSGSGSYDRDEVIAAHQWFLVLADFLTRKGIAVLRYDQRGVGQSSGSHETALLEDFAGDAQAALGYLKARPELDARRLGMIGHGEGGVLASLVASRTADVAWLALLASPAANGEETLLRQSELVARAGGLSDEQIARSLQFDRRAYAVVREEKSVPALQARLKRLVEESGLGAAMPPAALQAQIRWMTAPWFREFLVYDPGPVLKKLRIPVLAMNGDRDLQVDAAQSVPLLRAAYEASGNKDFTVMEVDGVNHLFQTAQSGSPALYGAIEETISPQVLAALGDWLGRHTAQ